MVKLEKMEKWARPGKCCWLCKYLVDIRYKNEKKSEIVGNYRDLGPVIKIICNSPYNKGRRMEMLADLTIDRECVWYDEGIVKMEKVGVLAARINNNKKLD